MNRAIQFAIVREDPSLESDLVARTSARRVLLIASGGCTALTLRARHPSLEITLVDANPAQLELVRKKIGALQELQGSERDLAFNVESDDARALNGCGNFESLFRELRHFWAEFIFGEGRIEKAFRQDSLKELLREARTNKYWPVSFELFFSEHLLNAMFGPEATRHAPRGSYPGYFRNAVERGLSSESAARNRFLQQICLGQYLRDSRPEYLSLSPSDEIRFQMIQTPIDRVESFAEYDMVSLSNIFDWSDRSEVARIASKCARELRPGSAVLFRQLNNVSDFQTDFGDAFHFDDAFATDLLKKDESLFYAKINVGFRKA